MEGMQSLKNALFIYINGNGGDHDFAVAQELHKLIASSKVVDFGRLTAPVTACLGQEDKYYAAFDQRVGKTCLDAIIQSSGDKQTTHIFTDSCIVQKACSAKDYKLAVKQQGSPFLSVVLRRNE
jgi:hypothetical protein